MAISKKAVLNNLYIGKSVAEQEVHTLARYFIETDQWRRCISGEVDIILGPKGSGKSAIYALMKEHQDALKERGIDIVPAEKPEGQPVFRLLQSDPPGSEAQFSALWKLYFLSLIVQRISIRSRKVTQIREFLSREGLIPRDRTLRRTLKAVSDYVKRFINVASIETGVVVDPVTGAPTLTGRISFKDVSEDERRSGYHSVDDLLSALNDILVEKRREIWILLDRLDVVFEHERNLERIALRSLFRVYKDFLEYKAINTKIFLRTDIWKQISVGGFREASHLSNMVELFWNEKSLIHLIVERLIFSVEFREYYALDVEQVHRDFGRQQGILAKIFPPRMLLSNGIFKSGLGWILNKTKDGRNVNTPREIIETIRFAKEEEIARLERGEREHGGGILFGEEALHRAVRKLSKLRLEQTIYAEYPETIKFIEPFTSRKRRSFGIEDLQNIWGVERNEAQAAVRTLMEIGFFRVSRGKSQSYEIPSLYSLALGM